MVVTRVRGLYTAWIFYPPRPLHPPPELGPELGPELEIKVPAFVVMLSAMQVQRSA